MANIGTGLRPDTMVLTRGRDFRHQLECLDDSTPPQPTNFPNGELYFELDTGGQQNQIVQVEQTAASGGVYTLGFNGQTTAPIAFDAVVQSSHGATPDITSALESLSSIGAGNVSLTPADLYPVWELTLTFNTGKNEIQQLVFGNVSGGSFKLGFNGAWTNVLLYGATPATVQAALEGLITIGTGNIAVTPTATGYQFEFKGSLANTNVGLIGISTIGIDLNFSGWVYALTGIFPSATISTVVDGSAKMTDSLVNLLNTSINNLFNSFDSLLGVDVDFEILDNFNTRVTVTSLTAFAESEVATFAVDVTGDLVQGFFNSVSALVGLFNTIHVDFYWNRYFSVEFVGDLALSPQPALTADASGLTGINNEQQIIITDVQPGISRFTQWFYAIEGEYATIEVPHAVADLIPRRTPWQLVFLPEGEEAAGGEAISLGRVQEQTGGRAVGVGGDLCGKYTLIDWS